MKSSNNIMKLVVLTISITLVLVSCSDKKESVDNNDSVVNVIVATPSTQHGNGYFSASGKIETEQFANISTRMMGYISKIHVKVGDKVNKGTLLISINNADIKAKKAQANARLAQTEARLNIAEKDYFRFQKLFEQNSASQKELDDISTRYEIAKTQVEAAKQVQNEIDAALSYSNIIAPFKGVITSKNINEGDMTNPGSPLLSMETPGKYVATALVSETEISSVVKGEKVEILIKSNNKTLQGIISEVSTSSQNTGGQYLVKIDLINDPKIKLYSGMFVSTIFSIENGFTGNIRVLKSALIYKGQLTGIYSVSQSNTAILHWLKTGKTHGENIEILSGLSKGEKYIVSAESKLYNGIKLNIK